MDGGSFLKDLFDFDLKHFITLKVLKVVYILSVVLIGLFTAIAVIGGLMDGGANAVVAIIVAPLLALIWLIFVRIYVEIIAVLFRMGENTSTLVAHFTGQPPAGQSPIGQSPIGEPPSDGPLQ